MNVPTIGRARGIFEIFVPGVFLLLNIVAAIYFSPFIDEETRKHIYRGASNPAVASITLIVFGYLSGVLLRLLSPDFPDYLSAIWLRGFNQRARRESLAFWVWIKEMSLTICHISLSIISLGMFKLRPDPSDEKFHLFTTEKFPYIGWINVVCDTRFPTQAKDFYSNTWGAMWKKMGRNLQYFNLVKMMVISSDEKAAIEVYAAEALVRYISGMFYALLISFVSVLVTCISRLIFAQGTLGLGIIVVAYVLAIVQIVAHFRFMRIREVESVFAASFWNRSILEMAHVATEAPDSKGKLCNPEPRYDK